jgi:ubiquitin-like modifier-activating enzyme ATG7
MVTIQFTPFSSTVSPAFWHALVKLKLDILKLDQGAIPIVASYGAGRTIQDRETGANVPLPSSVTLADDAFSSPNDVQPPPSSTLAIGKFKNFNNIEDFKNSDKAALFNELSDEVRNVSFSPPLLLLSPEDSRINVRCGTPCQRMMPIQQQRYLAFS